MATTKNELGNVKIKFRNKSVNKTSLFRKQQRVLSEDQRLKANDDLDLEVENISNKHESLHEYLLKNLNKITLISGKVKLGLSKVSNKEKYKILKEKDFNLVSIHKDEQLSKINLMLNDNIVSLKSIPHLKTIRSNKRSKGIARNAFSPDSKHSYPINKLMKDLNVKSPSKDLSKSPSVLKNYTNKDMMIKLMGMYSQKKPVFQLPEIKTSSNSPKAPLINPLTFSDFLSKNKPFKRQEHEKRKRILSTIINDSEIECMRDHIQASFKNQP